MYWIKLLNDDDDNDDGQRIFAKFQSHKLPFSVSNAFHHGDGPENQCTNLVDLILAFADQMQIK